MFNYFQVPTRDTSAKCPLFGDKRKQIRSRVVCTFAFSHLSEEEERSWERTEGRAHQIRAKEKMSRGERETYVYGLMGGKRRGFKERKE